MGGGGEATGACRVIIQSGMRQNKSKFNDSVHKSQNFHESCHNEGFDFQYLANVNVIDVPSKPRNFAADEVMN